jgi:hypothetical protein
MTRYVSNTAIQWQIPSLGLAAQAFLIAAAVHVARTPATGVLLGALVICIGVVSVVVTVRVELTAILDRQMLDNYERILLPEHLARFRLHHGQSAASREELFQAAVYPAESSSIQRGAGLYFRLFRRVQPSMWWGILQIVISGAGATICILSTT